jgi:single-strand DNA-binding protein
MNKVILMGRLTRDPDVRYSQSGLAIARYTLAVDRRFVRSNEGGGDQQTADFISCVVFGKGAEFAESKNAAAQNMGGGGYRQESRPAPSAALDDGFMNIPDGVEDEGLPFN